MRARRLVEENRRLRESLVQAEEEASKQAHEIVRGSSSFSSSSRLSMRYELTSRRRCRAGGAAQRSRPRHRPARLVSGAHSLLLLSARLVPELTRRPSSQLDLAKQEDELFILRQSIEQRSPGSSELRRALAAVESQVRQASRFQGSIQTLY